VDIFNSLAQKEVQLFITIIFALLFSFLALRKKWFTIPAAITICLLACTIVYKQDIYLLTFPFLFALIGSIISTKDAHKEENGRTTIQVLANAGPAILLLLLVKDQILARNLLITVFAIALADTMSSELGKKWNGATFDMCSMKKMKPGLSGGISIEGSLAGLLGSFIMAVAAFIYDIPFKLFITILVIGFIGMLIDSYLGSVAQGKYLKGDKITESGKREELISGFHWLNNELVNLLSIMITIAIAFGFLS